MNKELKKLTAYCIQALLIIYVLDFSLGKILEHLYDQMTAGEKARANYLIKRDRSQVIVFGSSRALYHYHSGVIADALNLSVYNAGRSSQSILYHLALLKVITKRHVPEIVVLDLNEDEFVKNERNYELLSSLMPYYRYDKDIREIYDEANPGYKYWSWSRIRPYNSSLFATLYRGLSKGKDKDIRGYLARGGEYKDTLKVVNNCSSDYVLDENLIKAYHEFINVCRDNGIKLFVTISPRFSRYACTRIDLEAIEKASSALNVPLYNFSHSIDNPVYFADPSHLNSSGSIHYSKMVSKTISENLRITEKQ